MSNQPSLVAAVINQHYAEICNAIEAKNLLAYMNAVFSRSERERIETRNLCFERNKLLLDLIIEKGQIENIALLISALNKEKFHNLAKTLENTKRSVSAKSNSTAPVNQPTVQVIGTPIQTVGTTTTPPSPPKKKKAPKTDRSKQKKVKRHSGPNDPYADVEPFEKKGYSFSEKSRDEYFRDIMNERYSLVHKSLTDAGIMAIANACPTNITVDEIEEIGSKKLRSDRARVLLDFLGRKVTGDRAFDAYLKALEVSGYKDLKNLLERDRAAMDGVLVDSDSASSEEENMQVDEVKYDVCVKCGGGPPKVAIVQGLATVMCKTCADKIISDYLTKFYGQ